LVVLLSSIRLDVATGRATVSKASHTPFVAAQGRSEYQTLVGSGANDVVVAFAENEALRVEFLEYRCGIGVKLAGDEAPEIDVL